MPGLRPSPGRKIAAATTTLPLIGGWRPENPLLVAGKILRLLKQQRRRRRERKLWRGERKWRGTQLRLIRRMKHAFKARQIEVAGALQQLRILPVIPHQVGSGLYSRRLLRLKLNRRWDSRRREYSGHRLRRGGGGWRWAVGDGLDEFREVEFCSVSTETERGFVVGSGGCLGRVEGAQPHPGGFVWVPDFRRPFAPWPLPDSPVSSLSFSSGFIVCGGCWWLVDRGGRCWGGGCGSWNDGCGLDLYWTWSLFFLHTTCTR